MINAIPPSDLAFTQYDDLDVISAFNYFMTFMTPVQWQSRKQAIEDYLSKFYLDSPPLSQPVSEGLLMVIDKDRIGWYLYLIHCLINEPYKYEYYQGARIVPLFKRIGIDINLLPELQGLRKKISDLIKKRPSEADQLIFELLTALVWKRNGYQVEFLSEGGGKAPDLLVKKNGKSYQVECKRQQKSGSYFYEENKIRQKMVHHIAPHLLQNNLLLEIIFHVELKSLPETCLLDLLKSEQSKIRSNEWSISNEKIDITASKIDLTTINDHLSHYHVKDKSPQLLELIAKKPVDYNGFTVALHSSGYHVGEGLANNHYISHIKNAFGVIAACDAPQAYIEKARDLKGLLHKALEQLTLDCEGVVHIGMETFDGPNVEAERLKKIYHTIESVDPEKTELKWIFTHYFQSYSRPDEDWIFDETVDVASAYVVPITPLPKNFLVLPDEADIIESSWHWERPLP